MDFEGAELGSGLGSMFSSLFGGDPYKKEMNQLSNLPGLFQNSYGPYMDMGKNLSPSLQQQFMSMMQNPGNILQNLGHGYQQSPGYQFQLNQGIDSANRAGAANGTYGTTGNQVNLMHLGQNMANQDYNQYMQNALSMYNGGLTGLGHLEDQGYNATENYTGDMGNYYKMMAQLSGQQQQNKNGFWSGLGSAVGAGVGLLS